MQMTNEAKKKSFKFGDKVYMPKLGDKYKHAGTYMYFKGDLAYVQWADYEVSPYPIEFVELVPEKELTNYIPSGSSLIYLFGISVGLLIGFIIVNMR